MLVPLKLSEKFGKLVVVRVTVGAILVHAPADVSVVVTEPVPFFVVWFVLSEDCMVVLSVASLSAAVVANTVRVAVQVPPGAKVHGFGAGTVSADGNTKSAARPVSDAMESANVELPQEVPVSVFVTVAVYVTLFPGVTFWAVGLKATVGALLVHAGGGAVTVKEFVATSSCP